MRTSWCILPMCNYSICVQLTRTADAYCSHVQLMRAADAYCRCVQLVRTADAYSRCVPLLPTAAAAALTLLLKIRPHSARHAIIARELALVLIEAPFFPDVHHTPGVAHVVAEELSRAYMPGRSGDDTVFSHPALALSTRTDCPPRDSSWYRGNLGQTSFA